LLMRGSGRNNIYECNRNLPGWVAWVRPKSQGELLKLTRLPSCHGRWIQNPCRH